MKGICDRCGEPQVYWDSETGTLKLFCGICKNPQGQMGSLLDSCKESVEELTKNLIKVKYDDRHKRDVANALWLIEAAIGVIEEINGEG